MEYIFVPNGTRVSSAKPIDNVLFRPVEMEEPKGAKVPKKPRTTKKAEQKEA